MQNTVSIIIPTYNEERFIISCLNTVMQQTYPLDLIKVYVVDGGSKDKTCELVADYAKTHSNVFLLHNPGKIQSIAFNIGVDASTDKYIVRLDAHALYDEKYVELCVKHLSENPTFGNVGGIWNIQAQRKGLIPEANALLNKLSFGIGGASFRVGAKAGCVDTVPFGAFPRKVVEEIGGMRGDLPRGEDNEYNSRIHKAGYKIYFDPEIQSTYFARDTASASLKQMQANGESIGRLVYIDKQSLAIRHIVPLLFVLFIFFGALASCLYPPTLYLYLPVLSLYILLDLFASLSAAIKYGMKYFLVLPWLFAGVHIAYGIGTIKGLLKI